MNDEPMPHTRVSVKPDDVTLIVQDLFKAIPLEKMRARAIDWAQKQQGDDHSALMETYYIALTMAMADGFQAAVYNMIQNAGVTMERCVEETSDKERSEAADRG